MIKPFFKDIREAKIKGTRLTTCQRTRWRSYHYHLSMSASFAAVKSFQLGLRGTKAVAFLSSDTILIPKKERKDKDFGSPLLIYNLQGGHIDTLRHVAEYLSTERANRWPPLKEGKNRQMAAIYDVNSRQNILQSDTMAFVSLPTFNKQGTEALFLSAPMTPLAGGSKHCSLWLANIHNSTLRVSHHTREPKEYAEGWGLTENSSPQFSHPTDSTSLAFQPFQAPRDTTLIAFRDRRIGHLEL